MEQITSLTNSYNQSMIINSSIVANFQLDLSYYATQNSWFYSVNYGDFIIKNQRLHLANNIWDRYRNKLPCGLYVKSLDGGEPLFLDDFIYPRIQLFLLTKQEVEIIHDNYYRAYLYE